MTLDCCRVPKPREYLQLQEEQTSTRLNGGIADKEKKFRYNLYVLYSHAKVAPCKSETDFVKHFKWWLFQNAREDGDVI